MPHGLTDSRSNFCMMIRLEETKIYKVDYVSGAGQNCFCDTLSVGGMS